MSLETRMGALERRIESTLREGGRYTLEQLVQGSEGIDIGPPRGKPSGPDVEALILSCIPGQQRTPPPAINPDDEAQAIRALLASAEPEPTR